jgi:hypothetical protein
MCYCFVECFLQWEGKGREEVGLGIEEGLESEGERGSVVGLRNCT